METDLKLQCVSLILLIIIIIIALNPIGCGAIWNFSKVSQVKMTHSYS